MKIASLAVAKTAFLHLKDPNGVLLYDGNNKVGIELYSPGSAEYGRVDERQTARAIKRMQENDNKISAAPADERRAEAAEDLADLTVAFHHLEHEGPDGKLLAGRELLITVYSAPELGWIIPQVNKMVNDWGKFTPGSTGK